MTDTLEHPASTLDANRSAARRRPAGFLRDLEQPRQALSNITPNWFAAVMGTAIVAVAAASLPVQFAGLRPFGIAFWVLAAVLLVGLTVVTGLHWVTHREVARGHHLNPVTAHFYGAPPMALLAVGAATILLGRDVIGTDAAVAVDWVLWTAGTVTGLAAAAVVPYLQFTRHEGLTARSPFGGWLMPVVPPMVSASTGALLIPHVAAGQARLTLLLACYALFGLSLIASQ